MPPARKNSRFRLRLASLVPGVHYHSIPQMDSLAKGVLNDNSACLYRAIVGERVDYGRLFSYLFRRFGYPNLGWDNYKDLACYLLTTPHDDMFLRIIPSVGDWTVLHFDFLVPSEVVHMIHRHDRAPLLAWRKRALDAYVSTHALPDWMDEWIALAKAQFDTSAETWRDTFPYMAFYVNFSRDEQGRLIGEFYKEVTEGYSAVEAEPELIDRDPDWRTWPDDDPLKPYFDAASIALKDLYRPVRVRDSQINAFGRVEDDKCRERDILNEPPVAGYPCGALGNLAPAEFAELHGLVLRLGKGNARCGIKKLLKQVHIQAEV